MSLTEPQSQRREHRVRHRSRITQAARTFMDTGRFTASELRMHAEAGLEAVQREVLLRMFGCMIVVASLLLPIAVLHDLDTRPWLAIPHLLIYVALLTAWIVRKRLRSPTIANLILATLYVVGTISLLRTGIFAISFLAYALLMIAAPMVLGRRGGVAAAVLCGLTYVAVAALAVGGTIDVSVDVVGYATSAGHWLYSGLVFAAFAVITVSIGGLMHGKIHELISSEVARNQLLKTSNARLEEANERLRELNEQLESRIAERTQRLELANRELESFSYTVSHDLRSPLQVIEGFSALALQEEGSTMPPRCRDYLQRIQNGSRRMHDMIGHILTFSQLAGAQLQVGNVCLSELAESILLDLRMTDPARSVETRIAAGLWVNADPGLLRSVVQNLLGNAWKFSSRAEVTRIEVGRTEHRGRPAYFVRDNGVGFDPGQAQQLFKPFVRLHDKRDFQGNGVGLATAKRIIERHGGSLWAEGSPGQGATFFFTLDDREEQPRQAAGREPG